MGCDGIIARDLGITAPRPTQSLKGKPRRRSCQDCRTLPAPADEIDAGSLLALSNGVGKRWIMNDGGTVGGGQKSRRQQRLEAQLRENLRRRKEQARARRDTTEEHALKDDAPESRSKPTSAADGDESA